MPSAAEMAREKYNALLDEVSRTVIGVQTAMYEVSIYFATCDVLTPPKVQILAHLKQVDDVILCTESAVRAFSQLITHLGNHPSLGVHLQEGEGAISQFQRLQKYAIQLQKQRKALEDDLQSLRS